MAWAVEEEEYELCTRIKLLQEFIDKQNEF